MAASRKRSPAMCDEEPTPAEAKVSLPGLALAAAMRSATVLKPPCFDATSTFGCTPNMATAAKSLAGS